MHPQLTLRSNSLQISGMTQDRPISQVPTASSIYSQPSPEMNTTTTPQNALPPRSSSLYPYDVSPPKSPSTDDGEKTRSRRDSPDISPISDSPSPSVGRSQGLGSGRFNSNIPIAKKTRKFWNRPSLEAKDKGSCLTHWDVYSGEPTTSEKGKPPSTTPSAVKLTADPTPDRLYGEGLGTSTHISGGTIPIGRKRVASRDQNSPPIIRPDWKGAGGRHAIVKPMLDKPLPPGKAPTFPAGREKYEQEQREREQEMEKEKEAERVREARARARALSPTPQPSVQNEILQPSQPSIMLGDHELNQPSSFPYTNGEDSSRTLNPPSYQRSSNHQIADLQDPQLTPEDRRSPFARNPSNEEIKDRQPQVSPDMPQGSIVEGAAIDRDQAATRRTKDLPAVPKIDTANKDSPHMQDVGKNRSQASLRNISRDSEEEDDPGQIESSFHADLQHTNLQDRLPSRFSTTTYATTVHDSPPATPEMGSYSPAMSSISSIPDSILNRKRPVPPAGLPNSRTPACKPTPSEVNHPPQSIETKRKSLPKSPPEKQAVSRVASLEAKLDNLRRRRNNLHTVIHELTHVVQPSSIAYDLASRKEIKRTVEGLNKELAEVNKDEHETGIKLHRAKKREDEFGQYEPTSIWVRRVTS